MPTYVVLMKLTDQGARDIKGAPARIEAGTKALEAAGGKLLGFYAVMGEFDYVAICESPSDEIAIAQSLALTAGGAVKTTTFRAFTANEFVGIVKKLP